jgi:hypothetical protein
MGGARAAGAAAGGHRLCGWALTGLLNERGSSPLLTNALCAFAGYAALFGRRDAGRDAIRPGAFARTLAERREPLPLFWQHRPDQRIGWVETWRRRRARPARNRRDRQPERRRGMPLQTRRGDRPLASATAPAPSPPRRQGRDLTDVDLFEVSLVTHPMQHAARVHLVK